MKEQLSPREIVELCEKTVSGKYGACRRVKDGDQNVLLMSISLDKLPGKLKDQGRG